jgi:peptidoglycan/LPS O-acetylase OafA/YrhL
LRIDGRAIYFLPGVATFFIVRGRDIRLPSWFRALSVPGLLLTMGIITLAETLGGPTVFYGAIPGLVFFLCVVEGRCLLSAILRTPALQYLGTISYSFYLWSPVVTYPMKLIIQRYLHGHVSDMTNIALFATIGFTASVAFAYCSYRFLEDKAARLLHRGAAFARRQSALRGA